MNEQALLEAIAQDDPSAFAKLFECYQRDLTAYATAILGGDSHAGEDAVEDAFLDIWSKRHKAAQIDNLSGWIRRIVRNKAVDQLRKTGRIELHGNDDFVSDEISAAPDPEACALLSDERQWLRSGLAQLNADQREAIAMCYYEELSLQEIAKLTNTTLGTVKTRLFYARRKLHSWIAQQETVSSLRAPEFTAPFVAKIEPRAQPARLGMLASA
jgi:RNA polymerase sigma-70 factor (ECF subfamily)